MFRVTQPESAGDAEAVFGAAIRRRRGLLGLTQEELRRRLLDGYGIDLSKTAMSRLESGERPIRLNEAHALAQIVGISLVLRVGRHLAGGEYRPDSDEYEEKSAELMEVSSVLDALERELAVVSAQVQNARAAWEEADSRMAELQTRHKETRRKKDELQRDVADILVAREKLEKSRGSGKRTSDGDR